MIRRFALALLLAVTLRAELLDRVVASVNGKPVLLSRVDEQAHISVLMEGRGPDSITQQDRDRALAALVDQQLIAEQIGSAEAAVSDGEVNAALGEFRRQAMAAGASASDKSWREALARFEVSEDDLRLSTRTKLEQLRFVEQRFRPRVQVSDKQIETYYRSQYVPKMRAQSAAEKPLAEVRTQIENLLAEQQVNSLFTTWLESLRSQASIHVWVKFVPGAPAK